MILHLISSFLSVVGFAVILDVPKKYLPYCGAAGVVGWMIYLICEQRLEISGGVFLSAFVISVLSQIFARLLKCPVTVFLIPGIYPLVPGAGIYRTVYYMIMGESGLASYYLVETILTAGMIALGVFVVDILWRIRKAN
ncbi:MAG: threonine/serine exporter family protein [Lachnospiraceae bacterium]